MADQSDRNCVVPARQGMTRKPYKSSQVIHRAPRSQAEMVPGRFVGLFADRKIDLDRTYLRNRGENRRRSHQVAHLYSVDSGNSVDQRNNFGIAKVYAGLFAYRLVCLDGCLRREELLRVGVELALR